MAPNPSQVFSFESRSVRYTEANFLAVQRPAASVTVEDVSSNRAERTTAFYLVALADAEGFFHRVAMVKADAF